MTTATAPTATDRLTGLGGKHYFLLRRLHSLTGLIFGGYLIVHLLVNATIAQGFNSFGGSSYQTQVDKIHALPFLVAVEWFAIYLPILYHTIYGIWITVTGQPNANNYPYLKNWFYLAQRISAIVIVLFMLFHILSFKLGWFGESLSFHPHELAMQSVASHMRVSFFITWIIYPIGITASCYHLANGFWTAAITWGLTVSAAAQRRWGYVCAGLFAVTFVAGMIALVSAARLGPNPHGVVMSIEH